MIEHVTELVTQNEYDCGSACIAMVTGWSLEEVNKLHKEVFHTSVEETKGMRSEVLLALLTIIQLRNEATQKGRIFSFHQLTTAWLVWEREYIVTVPSLNNPGKSHYIVVQTKQQSLENVEAGRVYEEYKLFDPQKGTEKAFYTEMPDSYFEPIEIIYYGDCDV